ncbi:hypothetical protein ACFQH3_19420 [Haladaptatus sp. GCM10025707]|nr:hypothetical protein [Haladaptatus sp. QDMS2]
MTEVDLLMSTTTSHELSIAYRTNSPQLRFGVNDLVAILECRAAVTQTNLGDLSRNDSPSIVLLGNSADRDQLAELTDETLIPSSHDPEGYTISRIRIGDESTLLVSAADDTGGMYGALDLCEQLRAGTKIEEIQEKTATPSVEFRALKFNLPWSPYRDGEQTEIHFETCRDLEFWRAFLDMMARNRFNALTLWNLHPFPYMIKPHAYPEASPFTDEELERWQNFWHELFRMAANRGVETYIVNWNIHTTPEFAEAHGVHQYNDPADKIKEYTRACVTEVLNEYPKLTGLGTSVASWTENMTPEAKHTWLQETFVEGIKRADREIKLLHRSIKSQALDEMRRVIEAEAALDNVSEVLVPSKFNWSHGHSTTKLALTHDHKSGDVDNLLWNPPPDDYSVVWTVRNEDFFVLRWGDPDFIRDHIQANHASKSYVGGYIIGSEGYIPAKDLSHRVHEHQTWQYAFEKQWLFYLLWGRLLYDPSTPDEVFEQAFETRYGPGLGERMLDGFRLGSQMPEELAAFHAGTWDYTLYPEGFLAPIENMGLDDGVSPFISINELIDHQTLDPDYLSIPTYLERVLDGQAIEDHLVTPLDVADRMTDTGESALALADSLKQERPDDVGAFECELCDIRTWGHLSLYFAEKLRAGVEFETYRMTGMNRWKTAVVHLETAADHWDEICAITSDHYQPLPYATDHWPGQTFAWDHYRDQVQRDIQIARNTRPYDYEIP